MRYFHASDTELSEGTILVPAAELRRDPNFSEVPAWHAEHVWLSSEAFDAEIFGLYVYEVEPLSEVAQGGQIRGRFVTNRAIVLSLSHVSPRRHLLNPNVSGKVTA